MDDKQVAITDIVLRQSTLAPYLVGFSDPGIWSSSKELANCENLFRDDNEEVARRIVACWNKFLGIPTDRIKYAEVN